MTAHSILVADDDPHIRAVIGFAIERAGMSCTLVADGAEAVSRFGRGGFDLVVLDVGMPKMDGLEVCRRIRTSSETPILFLSARDEEIDRVLGLEIGGDDYVTKPFSPRELVARIKAILKRSGAPAAFQEPKPLTHGGLALDAVAHAASFDKRAINLTALEFAILSTLLRRPAQAFTREKILQAAYSGSIHVADRTIDSHVRNIRAKLAGAGCRDAIETVHGVGFRLGACAPGRDADAPETGRR